mmetsp:Transcript_7852/g.17510  ORF Transcript_7852/g.17510 Transcript_7852/m.17510 type:complete len:90 (-) Transcript_7852:2331-2600(-)
MPPLLISHSTGMASGHTASQTDLVTKSSPSTTLSTQLQRSIRSHQSTKFDTGAPRGGTYIPATQLHRHSCRVSLWKWSDCHDRDSSDAC